MKYIRDLEAAGFGRDQAEAQVQMVLDAIEGDLATKADMMIFQERMESRFAHSQQQLLSQLQSQLKDLEFRMTTRFGGMLVVSLTIAVALLTWLNKI